MPLNSNMFSSLTVPFYMKDFDNGVSRTSLLQLNKFKVSFDTDPYLKRFDVAEVIFNRKKQGQPKSISVRPYSRFVDVTSSGGMRKELVGADFEITVDGKRSEEYFRFDNPLRGFPRFAFMYDLGFQVDPHDMPDVLSFGILGHQLSIYYKGMKLNGKSFLLVLGCWGILLGDDFTFDALVFLNGFNRESAEVGRIYYTTNPYLVKVMTLKR